MVNQPLVAATVAAAWFSGMTEWVQTLLQQQPESTTTCMFNKMFVQQ
jgi:hypothetical protein